LPPSAAFFALNSCGFWVGGTTISGIGTGVKFSPRARNIGSDLIGKRVLFVSAYLAVLISGGEGKGDLLAHLAHWYWFTEDLESDTSLKNV